MDKGEKEWRARAIDNNTNLNHVHKSNQVHKTKQLK